MQSPHAWCKLCAMEGVNDKITATGLEGTEAGGWREERRTASRTHCRFWLDSLTCPKGMSCQYLHQRHEGTPKHLEGVCKFWVNSRRCPKVRREVVGCCFLESQIQRRPGTCCTGELMQLYSSQGRTRTDKIQARLGCQPKSQTSTPGQQGGQPARRDKVFSSPPLTRIGRLPREDLWEGPPFLWARSSRCCRRERGSRL